MKPNRLTRWSFLMFLAGLLLCACARTDTDLTGGAAATPQPTQHFVPGPVDVTPGYDHWNMSQPLQPEFQCDFARGTTLHDELQRATGAVAVASITGTGPARWNTPNGERPSQPYIDSLQHPVKVNGRWPVQPGTYTPFALTVQRPLRGNLTAGTSITVYFQGGSVPYVDAAGKQQRDNVAMCVNVRAPAVGQTYLVWLGADLTTGATDVVRQPMLGEADPYDPATDIVRGLDGPEKLGPALQGLPSQ